MTEQDPEEPRENPSTEAPPVNPFEVPLHAITADAKRDVFTQRWFLLTAVVGTLSRAVAWGLILFVTLDYMPVALNKLSGESTVQSRGTLATIAWLERMQEHRISLWICWVVMLAFDFFIRYWEDAKRTPWRLWAWNFFTFWTAVPLIFAFFLVLFMKLV